MDLDSWTPQDKARRLSVVIAVQTAVFMLVVFWQVLQWPWFLVVPATAVTYVVVYYPVFALLRKLWRY